MRIVRLRSPELIIGHTGAKWSVRKILELPSAAIVPNEDVQLAIEPELDHTAVMIATEGLSGVGLEGAQPDKIAIERKRRSVPHETVHSVAE